MIPLRADIDPAELGEWARLYGKGLSCAAIIRITGTSWSEPTVFKALKRAGVEMRDHEWRRRRIRQALAALSDGEPLTEVAERVGLSAKALGNAWREAKANGISLARIEHLWRTGRAECDGDDEADR